MIERKTPLKRSTKPLKRTALSRATTPIKRGKRPKPMSDRKIGEQDERRAVVAFVLARDERRCRARDLVPEVHCHGPLDAHERIPRSAWAGGYLVAENVLTICRAHHDWIGENCGKNGPAHKIGLHGFSWERPKP